MNAPQQQLAGEQGAVQLAKAEDLTFPLLWHWLLSLGR